MKVKQKMLQKQIKNALDSRPQRWLAKKIGLTDDAMSRRMTGILKFTEDELYNIEKILGVSFNLK